MYTALFMVVGSIKNLFSIDCVNIYLSQYFFSRFFPVEKFRITPHCWSYILIHSLDLQVLYIQFYVDLPLTVSFRTLIRVTLPFFHSLDMASPNLYQQDTSSGIFFFWSQSCSLETSLTVICSKERQDLQYEMQYWLKFVRHRDF